jgi:hypothetical protein
MLIEGRKRDSICNPKSAFRNRTIRIPHSEAAALHSCRMCDKTALIRTWREECIPFLFPFTNDLPLRVVLHEAH